ncbi:MAG: Polysulfide reductase NrfD [Ignavibacteriae bacterium]|nr:MAG: Polysulfide reductase NrfD [Ignavibacteriota bacterium]
MNEITNTRMNPSIDQFLSIWNWEIPVYLFLGGIVAGMMIISGYFLFKGRTKDVECSCYKIPFVSLIFLTAGMIALFLDLEHKAYVWRVYTTFKIKSPMSWGSWILLLIYPVLFLNILIRIPKFLSNKFPFLEDLSTKINSHPVAVRNIGIASMISGALLGIYTGVLLSSLGARPLWNSSTLWILFLLSGLSTAAAFIHLIAKSRYESHLLAKADNVFLSLELIVLILFLIGLLTSTQVHIDAAKLLLNGSYAPAFWVFVVGLGIIIPLIIQIMAVSNKIPHTPIAPIMVIVGGLILRFVIVYAGQVSHWFNAQLLK